MVSTVFRPQRLSVLIVNDTAEDEDGHGVQHRFVGLLSTAAQRASVLDIPGFGDRIAVELGLIGEAVHGHTGRLARTVLENLPRYVVLELSPEEVAELVREIVGLQERRVVRVFEVPEPAGLWTTVLVYFPRNRFSAELPERLADVVAEAYRSEQRTFESLVSASSLARLAVSVRRPSADTHADLAALERTIDQQSISWGGPPAHCARRRSRRGPRPSPLRDRRTVGTGGVPGRCHPGTGRRRPPPSRGGAHRRRRSRRRPRPRS